MVSVSVSYLWLDISFISLRTHTLKSPRQPFAPLTQVKHPHCRRKVWNARPKRLSSSHWPSTRTRTCFTSTSPLFGQGSGLQASHDSVPIIRTDAPVPESSLSLYQSAQVGRQHVTRKKSDTARHAGDRFERRFGGISSQSLQHFDHIAQARHPVCSILVIAATHETHR